jgi:hypothetical protein
MCENRTQTCEANQGKEPTNILWSFRKVIPLLKYVPRREVVLFTSLSATPWRRVEV